MCGANSCKLCNKLAFVNTVTFTDSDMVLTLPDTISYDDGDRYCFAITTTIPDTVTLNAPAVAVVGTGTTQFPLLTRCGEPVVSQQLKTRRRYPIRINTTTAGGTITILTCLPSVDTTTLASLNDAVTEATA